MEDDEDAEILNKVDTLQKDLRDKEQSLQDLDALNQTLIIKERESNDELQEARQALVDVSVFFQICVPPNSSNEFARASQ